MGLSRKGSRERPRLCDASERRSTEAPPLRSCSTKKGGILVFEPKSNASGWAPGADDKVSPPAAKIVLDRTIATACLLVTLPAWLSIIALEALDARVFEEDSGPVWYSEIRVSQGRPFRLYKFRILKESAVAEVEAGAVPKEVENRAGTLTRVGKLLKKTGLDELPQLVNVLRGEMSLVGPRPKPTAEYLAGVAEGDYRRTVARAGMTGLAQLLKGTERRDGDDRERDLTYLRTLRFGSQLDVLRTDLAVLARTVRLVVKMTGE